jgi:hypothetical protein
MPARFAMDLHLPAGLVRVGGVVVGAFHPAPRFTENLWFPVEVTVRRGAFAATIRREATILLPTVIVPGHLNELGGPDEDAVQAFHRHGYPVLVLSRRQLHRGTPAAILAARHRDSGDVPPVEVAG